MAITTITYNNKSFLNQNPSIADENKVNDTDLNEIKNVVNNNANNIGDLSLLDTGSDLVGAINNLVNTINTVTNYSSSEQLVGKWRDGSDLYRIVFEKTANYSNTTVAIGTLNTNYRMRMAEAMFYNSSNYNEYVMSNSNSAITHIDNDVQIVTTATWGNGTVEAVVYYTK